jgi:hypothetical protein
VDRQGMQVHAILEQQCCALSAEDGVLSHRQAQSSFFSIVPIMAR